jgi:hypothetical protein
MDAIGFPPGATGGAVKCQRLVSGSASPSATIASLLSQDDAHARDLEVVHGADAQLPAREGIELVPDEVLHLRCIHIVRDGDEAVIPLDAPPVQAVVIPIALAQHGVGPERLRVFGPGLEPGRRLERGPWVGGAKGQVPQAGLRGNARCSQAGRQEDARKIPGGY